MSARPTGDRIQDWLPIRYRGNSRRTSKWCQAATDGPPVQWEGSYSPGQLGGSSSNVGSCPHNSSRCHSSRKQSEKKGDLLQNIRQYDESCQLDIGHNLSFADSILTNRRENTRFWLRKIIWETCDMVLCTSSGV